jgi:hypothetical protein
MKKTSIINLFAILSCSLCLKSFGQTPGKVEKILREARSTPDLNQKLSSNVSGFTTTSKTGPNSQGPFLNYKNLRTANTSTIAENEGKTMVVIINNRMYLQFNV